MGDLGLVVVVGVVDVGFGAAVCFGNVVRRPFVVFSFSWVGSESRNDLRGVVVTHFSFICSWELLKSATDQLGKAETIFAGLLCNVATSM